MFVSLALSKLIWEMWVISNLFRSFVSPESEWTWMCSVLYTFDKIYISLCWCEPHPNIVFMYFDFFCTPLSFAPFSFILWVCINFCYLSLHTYDIQFVSVNIIKPFYFRCKLSEVKQRSSNSKLVYSSHFYRKWWQILFDANKEFMSTKKKKT